jgi:hypothetical protein
MAVHWRGISGLRGIMDSGRSGNVWGGMLGGGVSGAGTDSAVGRWRSRRGGGECAGGGCAYPRCPVLRPELRAQQLNLRGRFGADWPGDAIHPSPQACVAMRQGTTGRRYLAGMRPDGWGRFASISPDQLLIAHRGGAATNASRRGWACPALVICPWCGTGAGQAQPLRDAQSGLGVGHGII